MNEQNNQEAQEAINPVNQSAPRTGVLQETQDNEAAAENQDNTPVRHASPARTAGKHLSYILEAEKEINKKVRAEQGTPKDGSMGKTLSPNPEKKTPPSTDAAENKPAANLVHGEEKPLQALPVRGAPKNWTSEDKELFSKIPKEGQAVMLKLNQNLVSGFNRKMQEASGYKQGLEEITQALTPIVRGRYENFDAFISEVHDMQSFAAQLKKNPYRTLAVLAEHNGVDLQQLAGYQPNPTEEALLPIQAQIEQLNKSINARQARPNHPEQEQYGNMSQTIQTFTDAIDESGNPKYPHFSKLARVMGALIESGEDYDGLDDLSKLDKAYNEALYTLPQTRTQAQKVQEAQSAATLQKNAQLAKAKAALALKTVATGGNAIPKRVKGKNPLDYIYEAEQQLANK